MRNSSEHTPRLLLLVAGAKGAIGTTLAASITAMQTNPQPIVRALTTADKFPFLGPCPSVVMAGWDTSSNAMDKALAHHGVLPEALWRPHASRLAELVIYDPPADTGTIGDQVIQIESDIRKCRERFPDARPVLVNLLPAACDVINPESFTEMEAIRSQNADTVLPDLAYVAAAIETGVPVVNFTPNTVELPAMLSLAETNGVPVAGRDGKTGQTYFKVVLASALKARGLYVDGWYSLNILGNADGRNLMDPDNASGKVKNKTRLLDEILEYPVGEGYGHPTHKVHIDYYPPRGDAKEAWDAIDITGLFGMPMSLRLNLQGRDSVLAAPMVLDLARWVAALTMAGVAGPIPDLGFFFKKAVGSGAPLTFQDQLAALSRLEAMIHSRMGESTR